MSSDWNFKLVALLRTLPVTCDVCACFLCLQWQMETKHHTQHQSERKLKPVRDLPYRRQFPSRRRTTPSPSPSLLFVIRFHRQCDVFLSRETTSPPFLTLFSTSCRYSSPPIPCHITHNRQPPFTFFLVRSTVLGRHPRVPTFATSNISVKH